VVTPPGATLTLRSHSADATRALAAVVARHLDAGDLVALTGELGAGKTCFVQGAADGLGVTDHVRSPSFMLRRDYEGRIGVTHLDVYRLDTLDEVVDLGHDEPGQAGRVTFVEWADAIRPLLPADHLEVEFRLPPASALDRPSTAEVEEERTVFLRPHGRAWHERIPALAADCDAWVRR
jgi:tRNA threonylcarbamoyladenosine biosynthesis protein TsaE